VVAHRAFGGAPLMAPDPARERHQEVIAGGDRDRVVKARVGEAELVAGRISPYS
jgi:hypothetical protein